MPPLVPSVIRPEENLQSLREAMDQVAQVLDGLGLSGADGKPVMFDGAGDLKAMIPGLKSDARGLNVLPVSDADTTLIKVGVSGDPEMSWDQSEDAFALNKGLRVTIPDDTTGAGVVIQNTDGYLQLKNNTVIANAFFPLFQAKTSGIGLPVMLRARIPAADDSGTVGCMIFEVRQDDNTVIATRPLFQWQNLGTNRMTMAANGSLGIGTVSPSARLHVDDAGSSETYMFRSTIDNTDTWNARFDGGHTGDSMNIQVIGANTGVLFRYHNLGTANYDALLTEFGIWTNSSDMKNKKDITDISVKVAKETLLSLRPRSYNLKGKENRVRHDYGFGAQEVEVALPEAIYKGQRPDEEEPFYTMTDKPIVALLTRVTQELIADVENLKRQLL